MESKLKGRHYSGFRDNLGSLLTRFENPMLFSSHTFYRNGESAGQNDLLVRKVGVKGPLQDVMKGC